jgi:ParB-like chromosome segregation protein Spo0J
MELGWASDSNRVEAWLKEKWEQIQDEERVQQWLNPNYDEPPAPRNVRLEPHQREVLRV